MIHPNHSNNIVNVAPNVGKLINYDKEYTFGSDFEIELKREVSKIVPPNKIYAIFNENILNTNNFFKKRSIFISQYICVF